MNDKHYAELDARHGQFTARAGDTVVASSEDVIILREFYQGRALAPVVYFPPAALVRGFYTESDHSTHCPIKGDAGYYDLNIGGRVLANAAWYYGDPVPALAGLAHYVAFYPEHVSVTPAPE